MTCYRSVSLTVFHHMGTMIEKNPKGIKFGLSCDRFGGKARVELCHLEEATIVSPTLVIRLASLFTLIIGSSLMADHRRGLERVKPFPTETSG